MAKPSTDEKDDADRDEADESAERDDADSSEEEAAGERASDEAQGDESGEAQGDEDEPKAADKEDAAKELSSDEVAEDDEQAAAQLGIQRYVLAAFFTAGILGAYVLGKLVHGVWSWASNKDWFHNTLPALAAFTDEQKTNYGTALGALIALLLVVRTYRKPSVRAWADEVASELSKVKWPTRKEVSNSTVVVIAAGAVATIYLALLDRLWSFVTDLFYGTGSGS